MPASAVELGKARAVLLRWERDPVAFVVEELLQPGEELDAFQVDLLRAYGDDRIDRIAMKSAKGPGKTAGLAFCVLHFLIVKGLLHFPKNVKVGATSITGDNIDMNLWPEIQKWMHRSEFVRTALVWTKSRVFLRTRPEQVFAERRTWPKKANPEEQADALAGLHADFVMFVLDESGGIPQSVMVTAEAVLATEGQQGKVIQSGNPTHTTGPLYRACTVDRAHWHVITVTGDPDNPKRSRRIKIEHARKQIAQYGRENPWVMVNILGEFPPSSINALLGAEDVEAAMNRHLPIGLWGHMQKRLGVDVARFGDDKTIIFPRQGMAAFRPIVMRHQRTDEIAARVAMAEERWARDGSRDILTLIDNTYHWGNGVIDQLVASGRAPIGVNYAAKAIDPRFKNRRAEMWIKGATAIKRGAALPRVFEMIAELTEPTYTYLGGQFVLEDKDLIKERLGRSPDYADGYMTTYAIEDLPAAVIESLRSRRVATHDFDPYALPEEVAPALGLAEADFDPLNPDL